MNRDLKYIETYSVLRHVVVIALICFLSFESFGQDQHISYEYSDGNVIVSIDNRVSVFMLFISFSLLEIKGPRSATPVFVLDNV